MKTPAPPPVSPSPENLATRLGAILTAGLAPWAIDVKSEYLPWEKFRFKTPPDGVSVEDWWLTVRVARRANARNLELLVDKEGEPFSYSLPDEVLRATDEIARDASGQIAISELVTNPDSRARYVVNSLIEEAITSSQLEGAATSRRDAKDMIRSRRAPKDDSERMILNNYLAMERIREVVDQPLTPELVRELHRIVTDGTLENPEYAGRLQDDDAMRVSVWGEGNQLLHRPPPVAELEARLQALCDFANDKSGVPYLPPVLRALTIHFMMGYDHYYEDGNGRTARALFYWSMLRQGYWLTEFLSISRILRKAPSKYVRSFLLTEDDDGDLTHFYIYHLGVIQRAIADLHAYLAAKADEVRDVQTRLKGLPGEFNYRQIALIDHATRNAAAVYTVKSHGASHRVSTETARQDLQALEGRGLLERFKVSKQYLWRPVADLASKL